MTSPTIFIVTGAPASGKTTIASFLAQRLARPLLSKDAIKEALLDAEVAPISVERTKELGRQAVLALFEQAEETLRQETSFIVESNFHPDKDTERFVRLLGVVPAKIVQIVCEADGRTLLERFVERAASGRRHPGHADGLRVEEFSQVLLRNPEHVLALPGILIRVDTTNWNLVDMESLARQVEEAEKDA